MFGDSIVDSTSHSKIVCDPLVEQLNQLTIDNDLTNQSWNLFRSQRGGYKLCSIGYSYTIDKPKLADVPNASKIYWKCAIPSCPGRAISSGLNPPLKLTQSHKNHEPEPGIVEKLICIKTIKLQAQNSSDYPRSIIRKAQLNLSDECVSMLKKDAVRQLITRERNKACLSGFNAKSKSKSTYYSR